MWLWGGLGLAAGVLAWTAANRVAALTKVYFLILASLVLWLVLRRLGRPRLALAAPLALAGLLLLALVKPFSGPYDLVVIGYRPLAGLTAVKASIQAHPDSPRWSYIDGQESVYYLVVPLAPLDPGDDVEVLVNGRSHGNPPRSQEGMVRFEASVAIVLPKEEVRGREFVEVELRIGKAAKALLQTASGNPSTRSSQSVLKQGQWRPFEEHMHGQRFVIEIRITDPQFRVLGLLS